MKFAVRQFIFGLMVSMFFAGPATAQYMKILTDNPADNTRLRASGTTILTITLDTNHDKNGLEQTCNSHTTANCGAATTAQPLDMFSYTLALKAVGGTVTWGTFSAADAAYTDTSPQIQNDTEVEVNKSRPTGSFTPPGLSTIGTIPVTPVSGSPGVQVQVGAGTVNPFGFGTGFGTSCDGFAFPNTYVIGDPTDPCGVVNGTTGDWFDADGALSSSGNTPPIIAAPNTATVAEGSPVNLLATATDPESGNTLTITQTGTPGFLTFTPQAPGPSPRTATVTGTPGFGDAGTYNINWLVDDGAGGTANTTTVLTISNTDRAPTLTQPADMTVNEGSTAEQVVTGTDPDGDPLTFQIVSGPPYMTILTDTGTTGTVRLLPSFTQSGTASATIRATDGELFDDKSFTITVNNTNRVPVLDAVANMTVNEGATADQVITGSDPDSDPLTFTKATGPAFMTVTTTTVTSGNIHLAPTAGSAGTYSASATAGDGSLSDTQSFVITVNGSGGNVAPALDPIANMTVTEGATADQAITATDPNGDPLTFSKATGPTFMTVTTTSAGTGTGTGNVHLAPIVGDAGTYSASATASDGSGSDTETFTITVNAAGPDNVAPVLAQPADMTVDEGSTADQAITATDADGDPLSFSKVSGPTFLTVTTTTAGTGTGTGNIHLVPDFSVAAGTYSATVSASDGSLSDSKTFTITVNNVNRAPTMDAIANMTVTEGATADQIITGTDPDGDPLTFAKATGPAFMTVTTTNATSGNVHLAPVVGDAGTYLASVTASDASLSDTESFTITVNPFVAGNDAPVLTQPANMTVNENATADQTITATDANGDPLTFTLASGPTFATVTTTTAGTGTGTGNVHLAPVVGDAGTYLASATASDGSLSDTESFTITVNPATGNVAPVLAQPADMTVNENATADQTITATDADSDPLSFSLVSGPTFVTVTTTTAGTGTGTGNIHLAPGFSDAGTYSATVRASDGALSNDKTLTITVNNVNRAPTLNAIADMTVTEGGTADQIITGSDPDGDPLTFTAATGPTFMTVTTTNATSGNVHLAPVVGDAGTQPASATVSDGSLSDTQSFTITVNPFVAGNEAPVLTQPANMTVNENATADQTITATDADGDPLSFSLVSGPTFATVTTTTAGTGTGTGNIHLAPGFSDAGTYSATVRASDGALSNDKTLTITVNNVNRAPTLNAIANMTVTEGATADQIINGSDPDGDPLTFSKQTGPTFVTVTTTDATTGNVHVAPLTGDASGLGYTVQVSVTDGDLTDTRIFSVTVNEPTAGNEAPVLAQPADMTVNENATADQTITATDANGDPLSFSLVSGPTFVTVTTTTAGTGTGTGNIHLAPGFSDAGTYSATVRASDGALSNDKTLTITVNNVNRAPTLNPIADMTVTEGATADQIITGTDPDGDPLTFTAATGPTFMTVTTTNATSGNIHLAPVVGDAGTYSASATASDGSLSDTQSFTITVNPAGGGNVAPVLTQPANMTVNEGATADQTITATDANGDPLTFSLVSGPTFATVTTTTAGTGTGTGNIHLAPGFSDAGTYSATVRASDGSLSNDKTFTITVNNVGVGFEVNVFLDGGDRVIRLRTGRPFWCVQLAPANTSFGINDIIASSVQATFAGVTINSIGAQRVTIVDCGTRLKVCFSREQIDILFASLPNGRQSVEVAITGNLNGGGTFSGTVDVVVEKGGPGSLAKNNEHGNGHGNHVIASPNPLNPSTVIRFELSKPGSVKLNVYDVSGRLVKTLADKFMGSGIQYVGWDGTSRVGTRVASGVYFYVLQTPEHMVKSQLVVAK